MQTTKLYLLGFVAFLVLAALIVAVQIQANDPDRGGTLCVGLGVNPPPYSSIAAAPAGTPQLPPPVSTPQDGAQPIPNESMGQTPPLGGPAIEPSIRAAGPMEPAFTEADVTRYHNSNHFFGDVYDIGGYHSQVAPSIISIEFLTEQALQKKIGQSTGMPLDRLLCLVQYRGAFLQMPAPGFDGAPIPRPYALEIFDAHTGNRIAVGIVPALH